MLGFRTEEVFVVYQVLAAILHLGEIKFDDEEDDNNDEGCSIKNPKQLDIGIMLDTYLLFLCNILV